VLDQRLKAKAAELEGLELAISQQESTLANLTADAGMQAYEELASLRAQFDSLARQRIDLQSRLSANEDSLRHGSKNLQELKAETTKEGQFKAELEQRIRDENDSRTRTVGLPTLRETNKFEFPIIVRYGRLYSAYVPDPLLMKVRDLEEFIVLGDDEVNGAIQITPKPYRGIPLEPSSDCEAAVVNRLNGVDKTRCYIAVGVWDDSFSEFAHLRRILVKSGFEYRLLPIPKGEMIWEGGAGTRFVQ
jgi:hypothetical protein